MNKNNRVIIKFNPFIKCQIHNKKIQGPTQMWTASTSGKRPKMKEEKERLEEYIGNKS